MSTLLVEMRDEVLLATMNRPGRGNAMSSDMLELLIDCLSSLTARGAKAMILTGAGSNFCSGADTAVMASETERGRFVDLSWQLLKMIAQAPVPLIGALNGPVVAGGVELALSCDLRAAHRSVFIQPRGLDWGAVTCGRLSRFLPLGFATQLVWLQGKLPAEECLRWGLVTEIVEDRQALLQRAFALAGRIARYPTEAVLESRRLLRNLADSWTRMVELQQEASEAGWAKDAAAARAAIRKRETG